MPRAMPTPMPALAPVERGTGDGAGAEDDAAAAGLADLRFVWGGAEAVMVFTEPLAVVVITLAEVSGVDVAVAVAPLLVGGSKEGL